ncbi:hypothetical protein DOTSEDRAFT_74531 [Dothistroma septosporum NZE10]|uniref:CmcJ-like methyltransferase n=1 Tax=Dothistroma septosporum (strain NZE10 / CBS 128990) TaxID=675120 RepID=N1PHI6_DOTSN|nr:hypothetical protein DOTSEDRAFT_74531 [Dothistroma septosporum NZE10]
METGNLRFLKLTDRLKEEKPFVSSVPFRFGSTCNFQEDEHAVQVQDVRGREGDFTLDTNGFQYLSHTFDNMPTEKIDGPGHPFLQEVVDVFKRLLGAREVVVYDCNVRKIGDKAHFQAARSAHIDHTRKNAFVRFKKALNPPPDMMLERWQALTLWCPLSHPVTDWPLAVCDYQTIRPETTQTIDTVLPHLTNEIYHLTFDEDQRWYFLSNQGPTEPLIMKAFDSDDSRATYSAHASFDSRNRDRPLGAPRNSVDVRVFAIY